MGDKFSPFAEVPSNVCITRKDTEQKKKKAGLTRRAFLKEAAALGVTGSTFMGLKKLLSEPEPTLQSRDVAPSKVPGVKPKEIAPVKQNPKTGEESASAKQDSEIAEEKPPEGERERIQFEIARAKRLIQSGNAFEMCESPYLIGALYYSDAFLKKLMAQGAKNPGQEIIRAIAPLITPELRQHYTSALLDKTWLSFQTPSPHMVPPFDHLDVRPGKGENHPDAIDLFTREGTSVQAVSRGVVVLSEDTWKKNNQFSTSSFEGGNTVIVYVPDTSEFYRYCHLREVAVSAGTVLDVGQELGTVGNTGANAVRPGHGNHLHLEINRLDKTTGAMTPIFVDALRKRLSSILASSM